MPNRKKRRQNAQDRVPIMLVAGFVAAMLGVGGGLLKVPAIVVLGGVPMSIAVGSSSLMIGVTALTGFVGHFAAGPFRSLAYCCSGGRRADRITNRAPCSNKNQSGSAQKIFRIIAGPHRHMAGLWGAAVGHASVAWNGARSQLGWLQVERPVHGPVPPTVFRRDRRNNSSEKRTPYRERIFWRCWNKL
jgi:Sulfite exporter TauE/SafE